MRRASDRARSRRRERAFCRHPVSVMGNRQDFLPGASNSRRLRSNGPNEPRAAADSSYSTAGASVPFGCRAVESAVIVVLAAGWHEPAHIHLPANIDRHEILPELQGARVILPDQGHLFLPRQLIVREDRESWFDLIEHFPDFNAVGVELDNRYLLTPRASIRKNFVKGASQNGVVLPPSERVNEHIHSGSDFHKVLRWPGVAGNGDRTSLEVDTIAKRRNPGAMIDAKCPDLYTVGLVDKASADIVCEDLYSFRREPCFLIASGMNIDRERLL